MARYTTTPWKTSSDLLTVRQQLYRLNNHNHNTSSASKPPGSEDQNTDLRRHAVDRIMAWKLRANLPHAVESTALLIDAQLHHQNATASSNNTTSGPGTGLEISEFSLRAVYAAAFTRFVTGFCDIGRSRERGGVEGQSSMLSIARQIGMPAAFVSLRHECTHEELPGLGRLVKAVGAGLEWLWGVYWGRLGEESVAGKGEGKVEGGVRERVVGLLRGYRRERRDALRSGVRDGEELVTRTVDDCLSLFTSSRDAASPVASALIADRLLLPTTRSVGESMEGAYMIWDDFLTSLASHIPTFGHTLIESLVAAPGPKRPELDAEKEAHALWTLHLSQTLDGNPAEKIMRLCCLHPGYWTQFIGKRILHMGDDELRDTWGEIFDASLLGEEGGGEAGEGMDFEVATAVERQGKWTRAVLPPAVPMGFVG